MVNLETELMADIKERAEHVMLVELLLVCVQRLRMDLAILSC